MIAVFRASDVRQAVTPLEAYDAVREAFVAYARGEWTMQPKLYVTNYPAGDFRAELNGFFRQAENLIVLLGNDMVFSYQNVYTARSQGLEAAARSIRAYEQQVVPGLLQTDKYAIAMIRAARLGDTDREIEQRVRVRMARQALLIQDDPIDLQVVLDEAVVSRPVGGDEVMRDQLRRLVEATRLPNVTLQILPFAAGAHAGMDGTFSILDFPDAEDPNVVFAENATGGLFLEKSDELRKYDSIFDTIRSSALSTEESRDMIVMLAEEPLWNLRPRVSGST